jgi:hypothetical protein
MDVSPVLVADLQAPEAVEQESLRSTTQVNTVEGTAARNI